MVVHIRYKGVFDLDGFIQAIIDWFNTGGYEHYFDTTKTKNTDFGLEEEYNIRGWYNETEYHRVHVNVFMHIYDSNKVEVVENNEKKIMTKAAIHIMLSGKLEYDYMGQFKGSSFAKKLKKFMDEKVINQRYDVIWRDDMHYRIQGLANYVKEYFKFNTIGKYF
jgi:hypothetical protein